MNIPTCKGKLGISKKAIMLSHKAGLSEYFKGFPGKGKQIRFFRQTEGGQGWEQENTGNVDILKRDILYLPWLSDHEQYTAKHWNLHVSFMTEAGTNQRRNSYDNLSNHLEAEAKMG